MNPQDSANKAADDAALGRLLKQWEVPEAPPPGFSREVWRRIDRATRPQPLPGPRYWARFLNILSHPRVAVGGLALIVLVGTGAGVLKGQARAEQLTDALQGRYVQSIDPFSHRVR